MQRSAGEAELKGLCAAEVEDMWSTALGLHSGRVAEAHGNRTHQGDFSSPSPVLKTGPPTSDGRASSEIGVNLLNHDESQVNGNP